MSAAGRVLRGLVDLAPPPFDQSPRVAAVFETVSNLSICRTFSHVRQFVRQRRVSHARRLIAVLLLSLLEPVRQAFASAYREQNGRLRTPWDSRGRSRPVFPNPCRLRSASLLPRTTGKVSTSIGLTEFRSVRFATSRSGRALPFPRGNPMGEGASVGVGSPLREGKRRTALVGG